MSTAEASSSYVPGVCNINRAEIAYRRKAGYVGLAIFLVAAAILLLASINRLVRLILFVPAFIAVIGFLQARNKFCVSYAASKQQNADENTPGPKAVADTASQDLDKRRARSMNKQAAAVALLVTLCIVLIP